MRDRFIHHQLSRRGFLATTSAGAALVALGAPVVAQAEQERVRLLTLPRRVYKLRDKNRENSESWLFHLVIQTASGDELEPVGMDVTYLSREQPVEMESLGPAGVAALHAVSRAASAGVDGERLAEPVHWQVYRVRASKPVAAAIDEARIEVRLRDTSGNVVRAETRVGIGTYVAQTSLIFPFRGRGYIAQGQANDGGHANRSGQFAIDALGLDERYAPVTSGEDVNDAYVGWGRELVAPAAGTVVVVRADRPDQPVPNRSDPAFYAPEHPNGGDMGNHVVIDHGGGEFSLIAHMMAGPVLVARGDTVTQGQPIGRLGNSGDTTGPHVHYQLQSGPDWRFADALPCRFANVTADPLVRGTYFRAE